MALPLKRIVRRLLAVPTIGLARLLGCLPLPAARLVGRLGGRLAYALVPRIRAVGLDNLDRAYGDTLTRTEKRRILMGAAENVGIVAAEFTRIARIGALLHDQIEFRGVERLDRNRGALLVSLHLGNWEWMAPALQAAGFSLAEIVRPLDDAWLNAFVDATRRSGGIRTIPKENAGGEMLRLLREGWCVGVLADQSPRDNAVPVTFWGRPCWATAAPALAALRARVPVHPVCLWRRPDGGYVFEVAPALEEVRTGDFRRDIVEFVQRIQDVLEERVRAHPEQWLWLHRRWKPRPHLEEEWARREDGKLQSPARPR